MSEMNENNAIVLATEQPAIIQATIQPVMNFSFMTADQLEMMKMIQDKAIHNNKMINIFEKIRNQDHNVITIFSTSKYNLLRERQLRRACFRAYQKTENFEVNMTDSRMFLRLLYNLEHGGFTNMYGNVIIGNQNYTDKTPLCYRRVPPCSYKRLCKQPSGKLTYKITYK